ncbi:AraC family ligand binding domain-containing protein [Halobacillus andaensis]|uniref:helix-turn-helix domain-containing protein n=1 Tax=Halobacillus andaensis TaxID=1176239 RepID=UPI003D75EA2D
MENFIYKKSAEITALSASIHEFSYKKHAHEEYAIGVTLRGIQHYHLEGSLQLSYPQGVMLFNPEQAHDGMAHDETGLDYVMLYIKPEMLLEALETKDMVRFPAPVVYDHRLEQRIVKLAQAILGEKEEALCSELFLSLTDGLTQTNFTKDPANESSRISKAKEIIHASLEKGLKLEEISQELGLSKYQFIRLFKTHTGISPYQYYLNGKIERAKQMIEKSGDIYSAVADCGFVDLTHLNKHFKCVYGTTAFEYKSYVHGGHIELI